MQFKKDKTGTEYSKREQKLSKFLTFNEPVVALTLVFGLEQIKKRKHKLVLAQEK